MLSAAEGALDLVIQRERDVRMVMSSVDNLSTPMARAIAQRAWRWRVLDDSRPTPSLDLSQDIVETMPPPHVLTAAKEALDRGETHYTDRPGVPELRQAVAELLHNEQGLAVEGKNGVVITCGGREALYVAAQNLVQPGDEVLVAPLRPAGVDEVIRIAGGRLVEASAGPDQAGFAANITDKTRLVIIASPDNPRGVMLDTAATERLAQALEGRTTAVIWDQSLLEPHPGQPTPHLAAFPTLAARTVTIGSLSFAYGLGPWRVGYLAGDANFIKTMRDFKQALTICTTAVSQFAALAALTGPQAWVETLAQERLARRHAVTEALERVGARVTAGVGPYVWADVAPLGLDGDQATARLADRGIRVTPGATFGPAGQMFIRVTLAAGVEGVHWNNLE